MKLEEAKQRLRAAEQNLRESGLAEFATVETPHGHLRVVVSHRLRRRCRKAGVWASAQMLTALKNIAYGFDEAASRSRGGADGIFRIDRGYRPANSMMKKVFDQFLDKPDPLVSTIATMLGSTPDVWVPVRVVSHHMRLLGVLDRRTTESVLVLIDYDNEKSG